MQTQKSDPKKLKLSRRDKFRRNPIPWIALLIASIIFTGLKVFPSFVDWEQKREEIEFFESKIPELQKKLNENREIQNELENEFSQKANEKTIEGAQFLPEEIDTDKIAKILELFALQLNNLNSGKGGSLVLKQLNFSKTTTIKNSNPSYSSTTASMNFVADQESIFETIRFLQTGEIPNSFFSAELSGILESRDITFLKNNHLPIAQIQSIKISPNMGDEKMFRANFTVNFFSEK